MQVVDKTKKPVVPHGVKPRYMAMGSYHASLSAGGRSRRAFKGVNLTAR